VCACGGPVRDPRFHTRGVLAGKEHEIAIDKRVDDWRKCVRSDLRRALGGPVRGPELRDVTRWRRRQEGLDQQSPIQCADGVGIGSGGARDEVCEEGCGLRGSIRGPEFRSVHGVIRSEIESRVEDGETTRI
jgi:hypothetical protein